MLDYLVFFAIQASIFAVVCLGLNLQWGYTGLFNIGVSGFFLVGAYTFPILCGPPYAGHLGGFGLPFGVGLAGALVASAVVAFVVGIPTLRLREDYLAIVTIGIGTVLQLVALNAAWLTNGSQGMPSIPRPLGGWPGPGAGRNLLMLAITAGTVLVVYAALEAMVRSPWGRVLKAIREDETAAASLGKNAFAFRMQAFVIGSAIMGLGGALYASFIGFVSPVDFLPIVTFQVWAMLIVGGSGNNKGAVLGAVLMWAVWSASGSAAKALLPTDLQVKGGAAQIILIGFVLMLTLVLRPRGLIGEEAVVSREAQVVAVDREGQSSKSIDSNESIA
ncbi:MAG: branched-chain amino acid ABC transporter permease [Ideonella sp.]|nr:branched-chain amino acid ABC transporter permease [Ideonella sp.]MCC7456421.1 branched-chain amino acid ABC transporter permease [Nitrospira sp.]